jgi:hypothetical protein
MFLSLLGLLHLILFLIAAFEILAGGKPLLHKILWLLVIFLFPLGGLIIYYIFGRGS